MPISLFYFKYRKLTAKIDVNGKTRLPPLRGFVDPLFQDLDHLTRFYISYCRHPTTPIWNEWDTNLEMLMIR